MTLNNSFPKDPGQLTAEHLTDYLLASNHLQNGKVIAVEHQIIGTGKMGDNARLTITYEGDAERAPRTLVAKFPAADEHARAIAGAQGAYYNEVMFYRKFAERTSMRTPVIYGSELSDDKTSFLLLMEDMAPAEPGSQFVGESREHAELALGEIAKLSAAFYGDESIAECDHVVTSARDDGGAFGQALMEQNWPGFLDRFGHGLTAECIDIGERHIQNFSHYVTRLSGPKTLIHGDFRSENILFGGTEATTVDWQTTSESSVLADAAYFMGGSLEIEDRRAWEKDVIETYRRQLAANGVELSARDCWEQYREYAMHGIILTVLGASFSAPEERSDRMFLVMIQRHLQHCVDLNAEEFLP